MAEEVAVRLGTLGFDVSVQEVEPGRPNVIASRGTAGSWFCTHSDVHPPHAHPDPWTVHERGGHLLGRGVLDAKGQLAALLVALEAELDAPATVVVTCAEETTGVGSHFLDLPVELRPADGGIVLEPTGFVVCTAQAGVVDIELRATAEPGHAWSDPVPASALDVLTAALGRLEGCSFLRLRHALLPPPRLHVGTLSAGEHLWRTPREAVARVGLGLLPGADPGDARAEAERVLAEAGVAFEVLDVSEPVEVDPDLGAVRQLRDALGSDYALGGMPSWTDAGNLWLHHAIPCVVFGAGDLRTAHGDGERVAVSDLVRLAEILRVVLRN